MRQVGSSCQEVKNWPEETQPERPAESETVFEFDGKSEILVDRRRQHILLLRYPLPVRQRLLLARKEEFDNSAEIFFISGQVKFRGEKSSIF